MVKTIRWMYMALLLVTSGFSQVGDSVVDARFISSVDKFKPGDSYPLAIEVRIKEPYHINAPQPTEDFLIPTTLEVELPEGISMGKLNFPAMEMKKFEFSEQRLAVYEGTIFLYTTLSISPEVTVAEQKFKGILGYQACDDHTCLAPEEFIFSQSFAIAAPEESIQMINQNIFEDPVAPDSREGPGMGAEKEGLAQTLSERGWILTFFLVFLGGLALNLTPCVYPLIPITISYFGGQAEGKKGSLFLHALIYVLGMAITYSILGVIAALTGSLFGAALQNPYILITLAAILVLLSLSMFDLYEIRIPAFLSNFAGGAKRGFFGTFFMGLTVGIVAAPCIGPFILALLTFVGERGDVVLGFWMFFVLAVGLGIPFIFLALFSGSLHKIPRSGAWMVWVRSIFGFILIAMAVYFLEPLMPDPLIYYLTLGFIMLIGGIYMAWLEPTPSTGKIFSVIRNIVGIIFFLAAIFFINTGIRSYVNQAVAARSVSSNSSGIADQIKWSNFSPEHLKLAEEAGKPVMIDFYADWCIPCKELDKFTFSQPEVVALSRQFVMVKVDLTKTGDPFTREIKNQYQIKGVPTLVFLSPAGKEFPELRVVGFLNKEDFLPIITAALEKNQESSGL